MTEQQTPTPIDPADIRPGDVFRVIYQATCERIDESAEAIVTTTNVYWDRAGDPNATYHLVHRPDPDAEAVEALNVAGVADAWPPVEHDRRKACAAVLMSLREQGFDVTKRAET